MSLLTTVKPRNIDITGDYVVNSISASGNVSAGNIKSDHLLYSNGSPYVFTTNAAGSNTQIQFNDGNSFAGSANLTFNKTSNTLTATYIVANGSGLTSLTGANVTGQVANSLVATTVTGAAQPNITSVGTLTSLEVSGNTVIGGNLIVNGTTTAINSTIVQIDDLAIVLANDASTSSQANGAGIIINGASANMLYINSTNSFTFSHKISADAGLLSNITGANVTGTVANATVAASANSVAVANVSGIGNIATLNLDGNSSNILYGNGSFASAPVTYGNSNVAVYLPTYTGNLSPGNLTVTAKTNLGNAGNITITGGTSGQVLSTDGAGNLSWATASGSGGGTPTTITVDNLTGDGTTQTFTLSVTPANKYQTIVNYNGATQLRSSYEVGSGNIMFSEAPAAGAHIEVTTIAGVYSGSGAFVTRTYSGTGSQTNFTVTSGATESSVLVTKNGLLLIPTTDYTVSGTVLTFTSAPANGSNIQIRELAMVVPTVLPSGNVAGINTQVQFNDSGNSAGSAGLVYNKTSNTLTVANLVSSTTFTATAVTASGTANFNGNVNFANSVKFTSTANLGPVGNVIITGGTNGQVLTTNGSGVLSWSTVSGGGGGGGSVVSALTVKEEGTSLTTEAAVLNFVGTGVTATNSGNVVTVAIPGIVVKDEGANITTGMSSLNFVGTGISAANVGNAVTVTVNGTPIQVKDEGTSLTTQATSIDFVGAGISAVGSGSDITVTVNGTPLQVKDEGISLTPLATSIDFVGNGISATNTGGAVTVSVVAPTIPVSASYARTMGYNLVFGG